MKKIILIGAGGLGREIARLIERQNIENPEWEILGFLDDNAESIGKTINGYKVLGTINDVSLYKDTYCVCSIGSSKIRYKVIEKVKKLNTSIKFATLIDPSVYVSESVTIGEGTIICAGTIITVNIDIGEHVLINWDCTIGHDAEIGDFVTLYPSANISGTTRIGKYVEIGTGSQVIQGINIGKNCITGAGAVITKDIHDNSLVVGVPARTIKKL